MDYSKTLKSCLENVNCLNIIKKFKIDPETLTEAALNSDLCCSNDSFLFVYLEQTASFLTIGLNRICKSTETPLADSIQRLSVNIAPIGTFKKCLMSNNGMYILIVYDKCLSVIELPSKWGKYGQYSGGSATIICKSNKLSISSDILDAIWHTKSTANQIICLTKDHFIRIYACDNLKTPIKEHHLSKMNAGRNVFEPDNNKREINIDMGIKSSHNGNDGYPIYALKPTGQIVCLFDLENSKSFEYLGELRIMPLSVEDFEVASFMCMPTLPLCLVILLTNKQIYHCLYMPKSTIFTPDDDSNSYHEDENDEVNDEAILFKFEKIELDKADNIKFLKDQTCFSRYFLYHDSGVHSVNMPWFEDLQKSYLNQKNINSIEVDEMKMSEINHLISTKPFEDKENSSYLVGLTNLHDFQGISMLIGIDNSGKFVSYNIQRTQSSVCKEIQESVKSDSCLNQDEFTNYIASILSRNISLPILNGGSVENLSEMEQNFFMRKIINLIRIEYIEKQKLVINEFQKRSKLFKQQESLQFEIVNDIVSKTDVLRKTTDRIANSYKNYDEKQMKLKQRIENCLKKLMDKRPIPMNQKEKSVKMEVGFIKKNLNDIKYQIDENKQIINRSNSIPAKTTEAIDQSELEKLKLLIKNENEKMNLLVQKVEKLRVAVKL